MDEVFLNDLKANLEKFHGTDVRENALLGYPRASVEEARKMLPPAKESAVMMLIFPRNNEWHTLFMIRPDGNGVHSNQLSFPGGRLEKEETPLEAALRETFEEVGVMPEEVEVFGKLSEIYIPPSHFIVQPFIGVLKREPHFLPNPAEVVALLEEPVHHFLRSGIISEKEIYIPTFQRTIQARYFDVQGHTLWGATAMMVEEFRWMMGFRL